MTQRMTFDAFQEVNARRCREVWREELKGWTLDDWAHALAAEVGEVNQVFVRVKQGRLPQTEKRAELLKELADVICFADLMITALHANTESVLLEKFDEVSVRHGWSRAPSFKFEPKAAQVPQSENVSFCRDCGGMFFDGFNHSCPHRNIAPIGASA